MSEDAELKEKILRALTRKLSLEEDFDFDALARQCPSHTTGADLYALCSSATICALRREIETLEMKGKAIGSDRHCVMMIQGCVTCIGLSDEEWEGKMVVTMADFNCALEGLKLSVSPAELAKYKELHNSLSKNTQVVL